MTVELAHDQQGTGPLLVLIHGITENRHSWDPLLADLAADHSVLRVDLRGHGQSPTAEDYSAGALAADIAALVDEPPLVIGHSLGGTVATAYAASHPTRGVINIDQTLDLVPMQAGLQQQAELLRGPAFGAVMDALFDSLRGRTDDAEWARLSGLRRYDPEVVLGVWSVLLDTTPEELTATVDALAGGITVPYLALNGFDLGRDYAGWLRERIPQADIETWDGLGHYPHLVRRPEFIARVASFEAAIGA